MDSFLKRRRDRDKERDGESRRPREGDRPAKVNGRDDPPRPSRSGLTSAKAVELAKAHLLELTGRPSEAVSALTRTRDGWRVVLEIVELERIPQTTDILASYAVDLDADGELMGYQRVQRYYRSDVSGDQ
ncbi:MAG: hypothetical protein QOF78_2139 [Phycisphaerales bacterium]|jgi:hypothetical protein|nr:hypothetical protein [Phycisphaerales bacterium]